MQRYKTSLGVDIGHHSIKLVYAARRGRLPQVLQVEIARNVSQAAESEKIVESLLAKRAPAPARTVIEVIDGVPQQRLGSPPAQPCGLRRDAGRPRRGEGLRLRRRDVRSRAAGVPGACGPRSAMGAPRAHQAGRARDRSSPAGTRFRTSSARVAWVR